MFWAGIVRMAENDTEKTIVIRPLRHDADKRKGVRDERKEGAREFVIVRPRDANTRSADSITHTHTHTHIHTHTHTYTY